MQKRQVPTTCNLAINHSLASYFSLVINFEVPLQQRDERRWVATFGEKRAGHRSLQTPPLDSLPIGWL